MPTFQNLCRGGNNIVAIPGKRFGAARPNAANTLTVGSRPFRSKNFSTYNNSITGVTKDSSGAVLGSCTVKLYRTSDDVELLSTVSDAITGAYVFYNASAGPFYLVAYKSGSPDVAGTTINTIVAA